MAGDDLYGRSFVITSPTFLAYPQRLRRWPDRRREICTAKKSSPICTTFEPEEDDAVAVSVPVRKMNHTNFFAVEMDRERLVECDYRQRFGAPGQLFERWSLPRDVF